MIGIQIRASSRTCVTIAACVIGACTIAATLGSAPTLAASTSFVGQVMTVQGPIAPDALGLTLPDEHLFINRVPPVDTQGAWDAVGLVKPATPADQAYYVAPLTMERLGQATMGRPNRDNLRLDDEATAIHEATDFKLNGGGSIVDATSIGIGRSPRLLQQVAVATGVHIIMGSGWYTRGYEDPQVDGRSVGSLADEIARDITHGVGDTGVRAGIIGDVSVRGAAEPYEQKMLAAMARASASTGAAILVHAADGYHDQLAILQALQHGGADLHRVALGRANRLAHDMPSMEALLKTGAFLAFDTLGRPPQVLTQMPDHDVAVAIVALLKAGYGPQLLLSQDVHQKIDLKAFGGSGYSFIIEQYTPYLKALGVTDNEINQMTVDNPRRLLTLAQPRSVRS